jgi:hypothetical protein
MHGAGILALVHGSGGWILVGVWLVGAGANYVPLALEAQRLSRPGALDAELSGLDVRRELRRAATAQLWIAVPFAVFLAALTSARRRNPKTLTDGLNRAERSSHRIERRGSPS